MIKNNISIIYPFYNNIKCVENRLNQFKNFNKETLKNIEIVFIDDCSDKTLPFENYNDFNFNFQLLKILNNIQWNQSGAHNLGIQQSNYDWLLILDIDHWISEKNINILINKDIKEKDVFFFYRKKENGDNLHSAPNIYFINKKIFWLSGGYDEDFAGYYGYEDILLNSIIKKNSNHKILENVYINVDMCPTRDLCRDKTRNFELLQKKEKLLKNNKYINENIIRFDWNCIYKGELK